MCTYSCYAMCHAGNASWSWLCEKAACKLGLGKVLSDRGYVVKPIVVRQGEKNNSYAGNSEENCRLVQHHCSLQIHPYQSNKIHHFCVMVALYRIALQLCVMYVLFLGLAAILKRNSIKGKNKSLYFPYVSLFLLHNPSLLQCMICQSLCSYLGVSLLLTCQFAAAFL